MVGRVDLHLKSIFSLVVLTAARKVVTIVSNATAWDGFRVDEPAEYFTRTLHLYIVLP
jgi:hypothetical protein